MNGAEVLAAQRLFGHFLLHLLITVLNHSVGLAEFTKKNRKKSR